MPRSAGFVGVEVATRGPTRAAALVAVEVALVGVGRAAVGFVGAEVACTPAAAPPTMGQRVIPRVLVLRVPA
jgi:hypothetical protein